MRRAARIDSSPTSSLRALKGELVEIDAADDVAVEVRAHPRLPLVVAGVAVPGNEMGQHQRPDAGTGGDRPDLFGRRVAAARWLRTAAELGRRDRRSASRSTSMTSWTRMSAPAASRPRCRTVRCHRRRRPSRAGCRSGTRTRGTPARVARGLPSRGPRGRPRGRSPPAPCPGRRQLAELPSPVTARSMSGT